MNVFNNTCALPNVTSQNICCRKKIYCASWLALTVIAGKDTEIEQKHCTFYWYHLYLNLFFVIVNKTHVANTSHPLYVTVLFSAPLADLKLNVKGISLQRLNFVLFFPDDVYRRKRSEREYQQKIADGLIALNEPAAK